MARQTAGKAHIGVTVIGNLSIDRVDDRQPSAGGCPVFALATLAALKAPGRIVTRLAPIDRELFSPALDNGEIPVVAFGAGRTSAFALLYKEGQRTLIVQAIGDTWTPADVLEAAIASEWVHVAPLLRSDFPAETLAALAAGGRKLSYDGQGLVRAARLGAVEPEGDYDPQLLEHVSVLKLSEREARVAAGGSFDVHMARRLGVPEILVTRGGEGCDLYTEGQLTRIQTNAIPNVQTTGAGDMLMVAYVTRRAAGATPVQATRDAVELVRSILARRKSA